MTDSIADNNVVSLASVADINDAMDRRGHARKAMEHLSTYRRMLRDKNKGIGEPCIRIPLERLGVVQPTADGVAYVSIADLITAIERHKDGL